MKATEARTTLLAQHEQLRLLLETCIRLARQQCDGDAVMVELDEALAELRDEFADHNRMETAVIAELLHGPAEWGSLMVDRMLEEHVAEHAAFWELLSGTRAEVSERIEDLADELDAHMSAEERTFLSPLTLREDVIQRRTRELVTE